LNSLLLHVDIAAQAEVEPGHRGRRPPCINVAARGEVEPNSQGRRSRSVKDPISNLMHTYEVAICHLEWIDVDEEVLQIRPMIATISPTVGASCRCFYRQPT
jgi:hypothetical protein